MQTIDTPEPVERVSTHHEVQESVHISSWSNRKEDGKLSRLDLPCCSRKPNTGSFPLHRNASECTWWFQDVIVVSTNIVHELIRIKKIVGTGYTNKLVAYLYGDVRKARKIRHQVKVPLRSRSGTWEATSGMTYPVVKPFQRLGKHNFEVWLERNLLFRESNAKPIRISLCHVHL